VPDAVPMAAAIGLTLECWRHSELETVHASSATLTDVVMARLSIGTTRSLLSYISPAGIDWKGLGGVLLDPERRTPQGRSVLELVGEHHWPAVAESILARLYEWTHIESIAGPDATLRLASAMGSTSSTARWWGNGWWPTFSQEVLGSLADTIPKPLGVDPDVQVSGEVAQTLLRAPDELADPVFKLLIDAPEALGLRFAPLPERPALFLAPRTH
jgi:hypothetical protein